MYLNYLASKQAILMLCSMLAFPNPAFGYLDPGSSSIILQALLAAAVGLSMAWKTLVYKVKSLFSRSDKTGDGDEASAAEESVED